MNQQNKQNEKPSGKRQFSREQYEMLKRCSDKKDMTEWNKWRKENPTQDIELDIAKLDGCWLQGVNFGIEIETSLSSLCFRESGKKASCATLCSVQLFCSHCEGANFELAHLEMASAHRAHFEGANFHYTFLNNTLFAETNLKGTCLDGSHLQGANFERAIVDGATSIWRCEVDRETNFEGVPLDNIRIDPATKQLLESNIRRKNWEEWYRNENEPIRQGTFIFKNKKIRLITNKILTWLVQKFWWISDYGISTKRIIFTFFGLAIGFAVIYLLFAFITPPGIVSNLSVIEGTQQTVPSWLLPLRTFYFSVVTMTTLGFGDMYAYAQSIWGHILLTIQVILGYVLLGALVTRFAVLFTAGGPAGKFADEKTIRQRLKELWNKTRKKA